MLQRAGRGECAGDGEEDDFFAGEFWYQKSISKRRVPLEKVTVRAIEKFGKGYPWKHYK